MFLSDAILEVFSSLSRIGQQHEKIIVKSTKSTFDADLSSNKTDKILMGKKKNNKTVNTAERNSNYCRSKMISSPTLRKRIGYKYIDM